MFKDPRRQSTWLDGHDYSETGMYFVTRCTNERATLLGEIADGIIAPTVARLMVESWWGELAHKYPSIPLDSFVAMPNHVHSILFLGGRFNDKDCPISEQDDDRDFALQSQIG